MPRIFDRLGDQNSQGPPFRYAWQKFCEQVESNIGSLTSQLAAITTAQNTASASMPDVPVQSIPCDYAGTANTGALPKVVAVKRYNGTTDVTTSAAWSASTDSGTVTYTIGAATGLVNITAMASNSSVLTVTSVHNSVTLTRKVTINKSLAPAPTGGSGGGTSASVSTFSSINSTTHAAITTTLTVTTGSVGTVTLSAPLSVDADAVTPAGNFNVYGKWQWDSTGGGVWVDVAAEVVSSPACSVVNEGGGLFSEGPGTLTVSTSKTGLAASSSQKFRLMARNNTGTRTMYFSGTASAVGS